MYKMNKLNGLCYVLIKTDSMASWLYILRHNRFKAQGGGYKILGLIVLQEIGDTPPHASHLYPCLVLQLILFNVPTFFYESLLRRGGGAILATFIRDKMLITVSFLHFVGYLLLVT